MATSAHNLVAQLLRSAELRFSPGALVARAADGSRVRIDFGPDEIDGPVTANSLMYAASIAKQVIGVLLARCVVDAALDVNDPINRYLPDLPAWAAAIQVRHLIHHTSGLPAFDHDRVGCTNADVLRFLRHAPPPDTAPGSTFAYSNAGYVCLAEIVSRVRGDTIEALTRSELFEPLGMQSTRLTSRAQPGRAGHQDPPVTVGDGGLWTTAEDLLVWLDAMNAKVFTDRVHLLAETPGTLDDATPLDYAWGIRVTDLDGRRMVSHGGHWPTWSAKTIRLPEQGVSVAILTSCENAAEVTSLAIAIARGLAKSDPPGP